MRARPRMALARPWLPPWRVGRVGRVGGARDGIHAALADPRRYERQIDRLHQRHLYDGGLHQLTDIEINLASVVMHRGHVARLLARSVERGEHELRAATVRSVLVETKQQ